MIMEMLLACASIVHLLLFAYLFIIDYTNGKEDYIIRFIESFTVSSIAMIFSLSIISSFVFIIATLF